MSAFPWTNLITAAGTLGAGLGAVGLKGRSDRKDRAAQAEREDDSARAERLRLAYADLVTTATEMVRSLRQILDVSKEVTAKHPVYKEIAGRAEAVAGQLAQAIAVAQMVGSDKARQGAKIVYNATAAATGVMEQDPLDRAAAEAATDGLSAAIDAFIDAVRPETTALDRKPRRG